MDAQQLRIRVHGRISQATAEALGLDVEPVDDGFELVCAYVDQAQLTGLLLQLSDLHVAFDRIEICGSELRNEPETETRQAISAANPALSRKVEHGAAHGICSQDQGNNVSIYVDQRTDGSEVVS